MEKLEEEVIQVSADNQRLLTLLFQFTEAEEKHAPTQAKEQDAGDDDDAQSSKTEQQADAQSSKTEKRLMLKARAELTQRLMSLGGGKAMMRSLQNR